MSQSATAIAPRSEAVTIPPLMAIVAFMHHGGMMRGRIRGRTLAAPRGGIVGDYYVDILPDGTELRDGSMVSVPLANVRNVWPDDAWQANRVGRVEEGSAA